MKQTSKALTRFIVSFLTYGLLMGSAVQAETVNCTAITSVPYTISAQGVYCFTGNLSTSITSGNAITINVNNVTIDLNGFKLGGLAAGAATQANGFYAFQRKNITIKNGIVRGFNTGIFLSDASPYTTSQGHVVTNILADQNTFTGIYVEGRGITIRRNRVVDTGGSTVFVNAYGILVIGPGNDILDNKVTTTTATSTGTAYGIYLLVTHNSMVQNNRVSETVSPSGTSYGILITSSTNVLVGNNRIAVADFGVSYIGSTGLYRGNDTTGVTTPFTGGTPAVGINN